MSKTFDPAKVKVPAWGIQDCDTSKSFAAFIVYRDLGKDRTIEKVAVQLGTSWRHVHSWFTAHGWQERVRAYDTHLDTVRLSEAEEAFRMRVKEEAKRTQELIFNTKRLVEHDIDVLSRRVDRNRTLNLDDDDSMVFDRNTLTKIFDRVTVLERLTTGASTENVVTDEKGPRTIRHVIVDGTMKADKNDDPADEE